MDEGTEPTLYVDWLNWNSRLINDVLAIPAVHTEIKQTQTSALPASTHPCWKGPMGQSSFPRPIHNSHLRNGFSFFPWSILPARSNVPSYGF